MQSHRPCMASSDAGLQDRLLAWIHLPASAALPFGTFEAVLEDSRNAEVAAEVHHLQQQLQGNDELLSQRLRAMRVAVQRLEAPAELLPQLCQALQIAGSRLSDQEGSDLHLTSCSRCLSRLHACWFH